MPKPSFLPTLTVAGLTMLGGLSLPAQAADDAGTASTTIEVRLGDHGVRRFQLDESHVVQFPSGDGGRRAQLRAASQTERKQLKSLSANGKAAGFDSTGEQQVSPVLRDASGNPWALPGGLIVTFREALPEAEALARLNAAGLTPERAINPQVWLVKSPTGLASIDMANTLNEKGLFADVSPNWWTPRALK